MIKKELSKNCSMANAKCYEKFKNDETEMFALQIVPNDGYCLRRAEIVEGEDEPLITYKEGYMQICKNMIDEILPQIDAVLITEIPEREEQENV